MGLEQLGEEFRHFRFRALRAHFGPGAPKSNPGRENQHGDGVGSPDEVNGRINTALS